MKIAAIVLLLVLAVGGMSDAFGQPPDERAAQNRSDWPLPPRPKPHDVAFNLRASHPSFYDRRGEWQSIVDQFWGPGENRAGKLATFNLYENFSRAYNCTFGWNPVNWDSTTTSLRARITDSTSRGAFTRILADLAFALLDVHAYAEDTVVYTTPLNPGTPILVDGRGGLGRQHAGFAVTPLADSSLLVYKAVPNHPLGIVPGDIILGYQGVPWHQLIREFLNEGVPHCLAVGSAPSAAERSLLWAAGENWHMFDTVDVVKHSTGLTVHLPLDSMVNLNVSDTMLNNEQLPISGVPMPMLDLTSGAVTYGIIQGTNIGYIYVYHHSYAAVSSEFDAAVRALMETDGLIIDIRFNWGGRYGLNLGFSRLMNHTTPTLVTETRVSPDDLDSLRVTPLSWFQSDIPADIGTYYDRPIAVLMGPNCLSYGDIASWQTRYISNARSFGRSPSAAYSGTTSTVSPQPERAGYAMRCPNLTLVDHRAFQQPRWGQEYPVDEEVWLTPDDVADGYDTVVRRAQQWIEHAAYAHDVAVSSTYVRPGLDSCTVTARLRNPDAHSAGVAAYIKNDGGVLIDSMQLLDDGLHGDSLAGDGLYGVRIAPPVTEDQYAVSVTTYDLTAGLPYRLTQAAHYSSSGPVELAGWRYSGADTMSNPGDLIYVNLLIRNQGLLDTVQNLQLRIEPLDTFITTSAMTFSAGSLAPGAQRWACTLPPLMLTISAATAPGTAHPLKVDVFSNSYLAWSDTLILPVYEQISVVQATMLRGWNVVSVPVLMDDLRRETVFPMSTGQAMAYEPGVGYVGKDTLVNGYGYWLRFPATGPVTVSGRPDSVDTVTVQPGWNLVGSITSPISVDSIRSIPGGIVISPFFAFGASGYGTTETIVPMKGYWVKSTQAGLLIFTVNPSPLGELPPPAPSESMEMEDSQVPRHTPLKQN